MAMEQQHYNLDVHTTRAAAEAFDLVINATPKPKQKTTATPLPDPSGPPAATPPESEKKKRMPFTITETRLVRTYFRQAIDAGKMIKMDRAKQFVRDNPSVDRSAQQKVRNLSNANKDC